MAAPTVDGDTPRRIVVVVVGGGPAGARTCEQLRRRGFEGELTLVAAKSYPPYDRPPLSKDVLLGERDSTKLPVGLPGLGVHVRLDTAANGLDVDERVRHTFTTGATPITLPGPGEQLTVRTLEARRALTAGATPDLARLADPAIPIHEA